MGQEIWFREEHFSILSTMAIALNHNNWKALTDRGRDKMVDILQTMF